MLTTQEVCLDLAHKLKNIDHVIDISLKKENFIPYINAQPWDSTTLSHGYPGLIIFYSEMDDFFPNQGWDQVAHRYVSFLVRELETKGAHNASLFSGWTGICFAIHVASKHGTRYTQLLSKLHTTLLERIRTSYLNPIQALLKEKQLPLSPFFYDQIAGICGVLPYLLNHLQSTETKDIVRSLIDVIVQLTQDIRIGSENIPGWLNSPQHFIRESERKSYPHGCFDTGLAHGIAGCLAVLAKAHLYGITVDNHEEAMHKIASWLIEKRQDLGDIKNVWPSRLGFTPDVKDFYFIDSDFYRDGWCYGAPGIASALFLASCAFKDQKLYDYAVEAMEQVCFRFQHSPTLECVSFCHGNAGLLTMVHQMSLATKNLLFAETTFKIQQSILEKHCSSFPFGYKCHASVPNGPSVLIDNAGFLDGVAGTALSLLFHASDKSRVWPQLFLIC